MTHTITPRGRVSFANVFKPKLNPLSNKQEYSLDLLFPKTQDISSIKNELRRVIADKWPGKDTKGLRLPIKDGDGLKQNGTAYPDEYKGHVFITFKSELQPGLVDAQRQPIIDPGEFYSGCYAIVHYRAAAYDHKANKGVSLWLNNVQKVAEGDPFGTRQAKAEDVFADQGSENPANYKAPAAAPAPVAVPAAAQPYDPLA